MSAGEAPHVATDIRRLVIDLLNEAASAEYNSFCGHILASNPYLPPGTEKDIELIQRIRDEEDANTKSLLVQLGRYRAGPTMKAFRWWKFDLNFLGLDWLVVKAAEIAKEDVLRSEALLARVPGHDPQLRATFESVVVVKRRHAAELAKLAAVRGKERQSRRDVSYAATAIPLKKPAAAAAVAAAAAPKPAGAPAAGAPSLPGAPKAPSLPGAPKAPPMPGAPKAPPMPGAPKAPPMPGSPPLPSSGGPTAPKMPSPPLPKPPGMPSPPKPPSA